MSVATVSRVLNGKGPVHADTEKRIRSAARRLRYVPHGGARSLITRRTHTIGVLLPDLYSEFFSEIIRGIDLVARRSGYHVLVSGSHGDLEETEAMVRAMRGRVDGLIILVSEVRRNTLRENLPEKFPVVLLNNASGKSFDAIRLDNYGGATAMVRHLSALGHTRIAFIAGPPRNHDASERRRGYRRALAGVGVAWGEDLECPGDFREQSGYDALPRIRAMSPRPSAVFAANDSMAIGLLHACREKGVSVPTELAITGFDDIPIARFMTPPLTSVRVPIAELGICAAQRLIEKLGETGGATSKRTDTLLPAFLVVRSSCGATLPQRRSSGEERDAGRGPARASAGGEPSAASKRGS